MSLDVPRMPQMAHICSIDILRCVQDVLRSLEMFSDVHRCSWMFSRCSQDFSMMFSGYPHDILRILWWHPMPSSISDPTSLYFLFLCNWIFLFFLLYPWLFFVIIFVLLVNRKQRHPDACWLDGRRRGNRKYSPSVFRLFLARKRAQLQNGALQALVAKTFELTILHLGRTKTTVFRNYS